MNGVRLGGFKGDSDLNSIFRQFDGKTQEDSSLLLTAIYDECKSLRDIMGIKRSISCSCIKCGLVRNPPPVNEAFLSLYISPNGSFKDSFQKTVQAEIYDNFCEDCSNKLKVEIPDLTRDKYFVSFRNSTTITCHKDILVFCLSRFLNRNDMNQTSVDIPSYISLGGLIYENFLTTKKSGLSLHNGHFICYKTNNDGTYTEFDDENVYIRNSSNVRPNFKEHLVFYRIIGDGLVPANANIVVLDSPDVVQVAPVVPIGVFLDAGMADVLMADYDSDESVDLLNDNDPVLVFSF